MNAYKNMRREDKTDYMYDLFFVVYNDLQHTTYV